MFTIIFAFLLTSKTLIGSFWIILSIIIDVVIIIIITGTIKDILECKYKNIGNSIERKY